MAEEAKQPNAGEIQPDVQAPASTSTTALDELRTRRKDYLKYQNETQAAALGGRASFLADVVTWEDPVALSDGVGLTYRVYAKSHEVSQAVKSLQENGSPDDVTKLGVTGSFIYIHGGGWRVGNLDSEGCESGTYFPRFSPLRNSVTIFLCSTSINGFFN